MDAARGARRAAGAVALLAAAGLAGGCAGLGTPRVEVREPSSVRPNQPPSPAMAAAGRQEPVLANGSIYQPGRFRALFEDRRARHSGDILTIQLQEKTSASQSSTSSLDRSGATKAGITALPFLSASRASKLSADANSSNTFEGKGQTASDNLFTGTITVTVIEVLPNGNLVVSGEKQVGVNQNVDVLRFSGVVSPTSIQPGNTVLSTSVADARVEFRGRGDIDRAQTVGWLARFFLSFLPI